VPDSSGAPLQRDPFGVLDGKGLAASYIERRSAWRHWGHKGRWFCSVSP